MRAVCMRKNYKNFYHLFHNPYKRRGFSTGKDEYCQSERFQNPYKRRGFSTVQYFNDALY